MSQYLIYCRKSSESEEKQVLSIESQIKELEALADRMTITPAEILTESKSAKTPGRPVFDGLMKRISRGDVRGVLCWKLDRLARNPLDGSSLVWALDQGKLTEILTPHGTFHNNSNDKFLMQIEFGMAKKYVDDLSDNVKRGNRAKLERGWLPHRPPLGYLNEPVDRTIIPDPDRFPLVQRMWQLLLKGVSPLDVLRHANEVWGLKTRKTRRQGGDPLSRAAIYALFSHPFYYGQIETSVGVFPGKHKPMITEEEFWRAQELLGRKGRPRPKRHRFAFTGLIRCETCGGMITAEEKVNRYGSHYAYYRCTKKNLRKPCGEKYVPVADLEGQIASFLSRIHVPKRLLSIGSDHLHSQEDADADSQKSIEATLQSSLAATQTKLANLTQMRLKDLLDDSEYLAEKAVLMKEKLRLEKRQCDIAKGSRPAVERTIDLLNFAHQAVDNFKNGNLEKKRTVFNSVGSNFSLANKKLSIQAEKPFLILENGLKEIYDLSGPLEPSYSGSNTGENEPSQAQITRWWALVDDVRTYFLKTLSSDTTEESKDKSSW